MDITRLETLRDKLIAKSAASKGPDQTFYAGLAFAVEELISDISKGYPVDERHLELILGPIEATL